VKTRIVALAAADCTTFATTLAQGEVPTVLGSPIASRAFLAEFYKANNYELIWRQASNREALLQAIAHSSDDGLSPNDFHWGKIRDLTDRSRSGSLDLDTRVDLDILLSDAVARLGYQLFYGKVHPTQLDPDWNFSRPLLSQNPAEMFLAALQTQSLPELLAKLPPDHAYYLTLKAALRSHRELASSGGWPMMSSGEALERGMRGKRVASLRLRLAASGDFDAAETSDPEIFDLALESAVRRFQERHGLDADGIVGSDTLKELNVPVEQRIDQIRVNLERARWVLREVGNDFIIVNIAGYYLELIRDGNTLWHSPVIVGTPYRKTPVFTAPMRYIEFNPTWTVPPTVLREDILPKVKADPLYLAENGFEVVDFQRRPVDMSMINWQSIDGEAVPFLIIQRPGPTNALGLVKFMLPNDHAIYIHDTPSRGLFKSTTRSFSSGCIRVKNPFDLAELLLANEGQWTPARKSELIETKKTTRVHLKQPLPVLLLYWTVDPDPGGRVRFYRDVYQRDDALLHALNAVFQHPEES